MLRKLLDPSTLIILVLSVAGAVVMWRREGAEAVWATLSEDSLFLIEVLPKVLAGCLIGAFLPHVLPKEVISRWFGEGSGLKGLIIATGTGILLPGGPFTIYPVGASLYAIGAGVGPVTAFITSWTLLGFNRVIIYEVPFMGYHFVALRVMACIALPVLAGAGAQALEHLLLKRRSGDQA